MAGCEAVRMSQKTVYCPLRVGSNLLPRVEEFKYVGVLFTNEGRLECEMGGSVQWQQ